MKLHNPNATTFIPDGKPVEEALARTTHLGVGAHQDDLEIMAYHGIKACYLQPDQWFCGVTCTDGRGSSRTGPYADYTDEQMAQVRISEQNKAAFLGDFAAVLQLGCTSKAVKNPGDTMLRDELAAVLKATKPQVVYTHSPADKHDTHIGVLVSLIQALRELPETERPEKVIGCEVWRNLDWMADEDKVAMDFSGRENLFAALVGVFDSQIAGGKRYDLASLGRARANATYFASHATDEADLLWFGMDLTPAIADDGADLVELVTGHIDKFKQDVLTRLGGRLGRG